MSVQKFLRAIPITLLICSAFAKHAAAQMSDMKMPAMQMTGMNQAGMFLMDLSSGTSMNPHAWPMPMVMKPLGSWNSMFMGQAFLVDTQQSGPRGADKFYSSNWLMAATQHSAGKNGALQFDLMLSLEPATVTARQYPLLFQTGETAFGKPIVDGQHPHDFIMSLGVKYAHAVNDHTTLELYFAPVGDPALGPAAFPHRASAMEIPQATLGHHWQDSTHIANEVVTAGIDYRQIRLEASGFHGAEPNENRWNIDYGAIDSWSTRLWYFPTKRWAAQVSAGHLTKPEVLEPGDQFRMTGSIEYSVPMHGSSWSSSLIWGRNHSTDTKRNTNSFLAESVLPVRPGNFLTGRAELVDKDELFPGAYTGTYRIGAYTVGYTHDIALFPQLETGIGANVEFYSLPAAIRPDYGDHPRGANMFIRFRLKGQK